MRMITRITLNPPLAAVSRLTVLAVCAGALMSTAHAQQAHGAHEHGVAHLSVAVEGPELVIELSTPLDNLVGFEHAPATAAQRAALADAETRLGQGAELFQLPESAGCVLAGTVLESPWPRQAGNERPAGHGHDHGHGADAREGHADLIATYRFECARPAALDAVRVELFDAFPRLRELRAVHAGEGGQGAAVLKPGATVLSL